MRRNYVIGIVVVLMVILGAKEFFSPNHALEAQPQASTRASIDVFGLHADHPNVRNLPELRIKESF